MNEENEYKLNSENFRCHSVTDFKLSSFQAYDRLCGLMVRVPAYKSRCLGFDYRRYQFF
jgi:hypothetical protein